LQTAQLLLMLMMKFLKKSLWHQFLVKCGVVQLQRDLARGNYMCAILIHKFIKRSHSSIQEKKKILWILHLDFLAFLQAKQYHIGVCKELEWAYRVAPNYYC
jgi:hypothetical protein